MEWNTENLEYYSSFWSILLSSIRVFRKSRYSENIQEYREKLYSSSIRVPKKVDIQKIFRNTEKNCIRVVFRSTEVFWGTKRKNKYVFFTNANVGEERLQYSTTLLIVYSMYIVYFHSNNDLKIVTLSALRMFFSEKNTVYKCK